MPNRPRIPAEIEREILLECAHRCAVCGTSTPLERAHIIPWRDSKEHKSEDLIGLCANCHERADNENWSEKTLRDYKRRPWVMRQYEKADDPIPPLSKVQVTVDMELENFDETNQRWLQYGLAAFLKVSPGNIRITTVEKANSVKVTVELPEQSAEELLDAYKKNDPELIKHLAPLVLLDFRQETQEQGQSVFQSRTPNVEGNERLRTPQREGFFSVADYFRNGISEREVGIVLPVGSGKSGLITIVPFAVKAKRVLVIAPGLRIAEQLYADFDPSNLGMFYEKCKVLDGPPYPELADIRGRRTNLSHLQGAEVVVTNIHQLQRQNNRWLSQLEPDFFDLILFDEGHHNIAESWENLRQTFPQARIINFSATPTRADGQLMAGEIIYSYPIFKAIEAGYVKRLKAVVLNPRSLRFLRHEDGHEVEVTLDEVRRLGEEDSAFRRSIVTSEETLSTIVDASIRELERIRSETGDKRHKIIASALHYGHCGQIVEAYRARGRRADYLHSREDSATNERILQKLENHELDVIVQVRMLGEGFDHPHLSVAAVCSIFRNLSPFAQFVGRIMRVVGRNNQQISQNQQGTVVFHAGANIAQVWSDFQLFSQADQEYFDQLLPTEDLDFGDASELTVEPHSNGVAPNSVEIKEQEGVTLEEIPLLERFEKDGRASEAFQYLREIGVTPEEFRRAYELIPVPVTKQRQTQAAIKALDDRIRNAAGRVLREREINPEGRNLDRQRLGKTNFVVLKSAIDKLVNNLVGRGTGERAEFAQPEIERINQEFETIVHRATEEVLGA